MSLKSPKYNRNPIASISAKLATSRPQAGNRGGRLDSLLLTLSLMKNMTHDSYLQMRVSFVVLQSASIPLNGTGTAP